MSEPAPAWPFDPPQAVAAPPAPPVMAPAPPAPAMPAPAMPAPVLPFAPPAEPHAALDMGVPLPPAPAQPAPVQSVPAPPAPAIAGPGGFAMPPALPIAQAVEQVAAASPAATFDATPVGDAEEAPAQSPRSAAAADPTGQWWGPGPALLLAMATLAFQLVSFYAHERLPLVEASGQALDQFDVLVGGLPLVGTGAGPFFGLLLGAGALALLAIGNRRGLREPIFQVGVGALTVLAILMPLILMKVAGGTTV